MSVAALVRDQEGNNPVVESGPVRISPSFEDIQRAIKDAIQFQHFAMVYQPQFSISDGRLIGFEALIRCMSPNFGVISPADFIPFCEESGDIIEIGRWLIRRSLLDLKKLRSQGLPDVYMSINLSPAQFAEGDVYETIMMSLLEAGLPASAVKIELTETAIIKNGAVISRTFQAFQSEGIEIWLDDFGTGFASLNLLREYKIDGLKIDKSFVDGIHFDDDDFTICSAVIAMAQRLGLNIVAEGIESEAQLQILGQLGCDCAQGFLLGRPASIDDTLHRWA